MEFHLLIFSTYISLCYNQQIIGAAHEPTTYLTQYYLYETYSIMLEDILFDVTGVDDMSFIDSSISAGWKDGYVRSSKSMLTHL